ncbi:MAG: hypothetical protein FWH31_09300 [Streptococcaceae bacterium]|nr:hypothetical protein [Streptococcaceae bacterium]
MKNKILLAGASLLAGMLIAGGITHAYTYTDEELHPGQTITREIQATGMVEGSGAYGWISIPQTIDVREHFWIQFGVTFPQNVGEFEISLPSALNPDFAQGATAGAPATKTLRHINPDISSAMAVDWTFYDHNTVYYDRPLRLDEALVKVNGQQNQEAGSNLSFTPNVTEAAAAGIYRGTLTFQIRFE